ncbi:MAG: DUF4304 domain-containing protein [Methylophilaceae bacterium]
MAEPFVEPFFSDLHKAHLKSLGYKKIRHTFSRELPDYIERVQLQGSAWNSSGKSWLFYINIGIQFSDLPRSELDRDFPNTHAHGRIGSIVKSETSFFELTEKNSNEMLIIIAGLLVEASAALKNMALDQRLKYLEGHVVRF